jgi:hypothetical protein
MPRRLPPRTGGAKAHFCWILPSHVPPLGRVQPKAVACPSNPIWVVALMVRVPAELAQRNEFAPSVHGAAGDSGVDGKLRRRVKRGKDGSVVSVRGSDGRTPR